MEREIWVPQPSGMCEGINFGIRGLEKIVGEVKAKSPNFPIIARRVSHNRETNRRLTGLGIELWPGSLEEFLKTGRRFGLYIVSPHGESATIVAEAEKQGLIVAQLTCPLVARNHNLILAKSREEGALILILGHKAHQEVQSYLGLGDQKNIIVIDPECPEELAAPDSTKKIYVIRQTTLPLRSVAEALRYIESRYKLLLGNDLAGICFATDNRQNALEATIKEKRVDTVLVVGDTDSSNSQSLLALAKALGCRAKMTLAGELERMICEGFFGRAKKIAVTAGASAHPDDIKAVVNRLEKHLNVKSWPFNFRTEEQKFPDELIRKESERVLNIINAAS